MPINFKIMFLKKNIFGTNALLLIFIMSLVLSSCVKDIEPDIELIDTEKYVITGMLTDIATEQDIIITKTTPLDDPYQNYIGGCKVKIIRNDNVEYSYYEYQQGIYRLNVPIDFIDNTKSYMIEVITPEGFTIQSSSESFASCADVGDVYWEYFKEEGSKFEGYQFFTDMHASEDDSKYYLYKIIETFEHHSPYPLEYYYDGKLRRVVPPDYSKMYCWVTTGIKDVFPMSTKGFSENVYDRYKLNYTTNLSQRLSHLYSLLIKQYSISEEAYDYWQQMRKNLHQSGGMYNSQPIPVKGNLKIVSGGEKDVLGFFGVSAIKEKRIFVPPSPFDIVDNTCAMFTLRMGYSEILPKDYPAYIYSENGIPSVDVMDRACVDCTKVGGNTQKPSYWP